MAQFSDAQIRAYVEANIGDPAAIADAAEAFGISVADLSRATGFSVADVRGYFNNAGVSAPVVDNAAAERAAAEAARVQAENEAAWARQQAENERLWAEQQAENERQWAAQQAAAAAQQKAAAEAATKAAGIASLPAANAPVDKAAAAEKLTQQILAQGTTSQWKGEGHGSAEKNAADMAKILADTGITDISQFGKVTTKVDAAVIPQYESVQKGFDNEGNLIVENKIVGYVDQNGKAVDPSLVKAETVYSGGDAGIFETVYTAPVGTQETFGNKLTGQAVASTYGERQTGNAFGGTYSGEGNTGYRVQFDASGNPIFYTTAASSSDIGDLAPMLAIASFIPALAPFAQTINAAIAAKNGNPLGAIAGIAGLGGYTDVANAANFANAAKSGDILNLALSGANLGGVESIGDYSLPDVSRAINTAKAIQSEDPNALLNIIGSYASNVNNSQPIDTYPETTAPSIFEEKPDTSSITASTQASSLQDILGDSSNQIINNAPFVAAQEVKTTPDYSGQPFSSAFAAARVNNEPVFNWNGNLYNTEVAKTEQPVAKVTSPVSSDVYPDLRGTTADKAKAPSTASSNVGPYVGYRNAFGMTPQMGDINQVADPRTLAFTKGFLGDDTLNKGFSALHPDIEGIKNAGDVGTYSNLGVQLAPVVGPMAKWFKPSLDTLGSAAAADESLVSLLGKNAYKAPENAAPFPRLTADDRQMSLLIQDMLGQPKTNQAAGQAWDQLTGGSPLQAYQTLNANPATRASMLDYAGSRGYSEVSPFAVSERSNLFQPAQYVKNLDGALVPNQSYLQAPKGSVIKASGGLIPSNNMDDLLKIING